MCSCLLDVDIWRAAVLEVALKERVICCSVFSEGLEVCLG